MGFLVAGPRCGVFAARSNPAGCRFSYPETVHRSPATDRAPDPFNAEPSSVLKGDSILFIITVYNPVGIWINQQPTT